MYQVYVKIGDNKWTEEFETYDECISRMEELIPDFTAAPFSYMAVINSEGTAVKEVNN